MVPIIAPQITVVFKPDFPFTDESEREVCLRYWEFRLDGTFGHDPKKLAKQIRERANGFDYYVSTRCDAQAEFVCACGVTELHTFGQRKEFEALRKEPANCSSCKKKRDDADQEVRERITAERKAAEAERRAIKERERVRVETERQAAEERRQARLEQWRSELRCTHPLGEPNVPQDLDLHLRYAMYWFALVHCQDEPWNSGIPAVMELDKPWIGVRSVEQEILELYVEKGLLYIDHEKLDINGSEPDYPFRQFDWRLCAPEHAARARILVLDARDTMYDPRKWPTHWRHQYVDVFEEIATRECFKLWYQWQKKYKVRWAVEDDLRNIIQSALTILSIGQVARIMWGAVQEGVKELLWRQDTRFTRVFSSRVQHGMKNPEEQKTFEFRSSQGFATEVALSIMSGTEAPWYTVSMRDVHPLLRVIEADTGDDAD